MNDERYSLTHLITTSDFLSDEELMMRAERAGREKLEEAGVDKTHSIQITYVDMYTDMDEVYELFPFLITEESEEDFNVVYQIDYDITPREE